MNRLNIEEYKKNIEIEISEIAKKDISIHKFNLHTIAMINNLTLYDEINKDYLSIKENIKYYMHVDSSFYNALNKYILLLNNFKELYLHYFTKIIFNDYILKRINKRKKIYLMIYEDTKEYSDKFLYHSLLLLTNNRRLLGYMSRIKHNILEISYLMNIFKDKNIQLYDTYNKLYNEMLFTYCEYNIMYDYNNELVKNYKIVYNIVTEILSYTKNEHERFISYKYLREEIIYYTSHLKEISEEINTIFNLQKNI